MKETRAQREIAGRFCVFLEMVNESVRGGAWRREFVTISKIDNDWVHVEGTQYDLSVSLLRKWIARGFLAIERTGDRARLQILEEGKTAARAAREA